MSGDWVLVSIPIVSLLAAVGCFAVPRAASWIGLAAALAAVPLAGGLAALILDGSTITHAIGGWAPPLSFWLSGECWPSLTLEAGSARC